MTVRRKKRAITTRKTKTTKPDRKLADYTKRINILGRRLLTDVVEIGHLLALAKKHAGHGHWLPWLETVGLSHDTATNFMRISELLQSAKFRKYRNMAAPLAVISKLAGPGVSDETREAVFKQIEAGEKVSAGKL